MPSLPMIEAFLLVLVRCFAFYAAGPMMSDRRIPAHVKILIALATAFALFPGMARPLPPMPETILGLALLLANEVLLGILMGLVSSLVFVGVRMAGNLIGLQMGLSIASVIDPSSSSETSLISELQGTLALILFVLADGHHMLLRALAFSLQRVAPGGGLAIPALVGILVPMAGSVFLICIQVGAPVIGALFLADAALGFVARSVPQINVFIVGMPIKIALGIILLVVTAPLFAQLLSNHMSLLQSQLISLMGGI